MAKLERTLTGDFHQVLEQLHNGILNGSQTANYEDGSEFTVNGTRCAVRMYERYSAFGSNRVALCLTLVGDGNQLRLTAITAGGSQAMFFKINTLGEKTFLDTLAAVVDRMDGQ